MKIVIIVGLIILLLATAFLFYVLMVASAPSTPEERMKEDQAQIEYLANLRYNKNKKK